MTNPKRAQHLSWRKLGEHTVILDSRINQEVHHLNEVGAYLWELCTGENSLSDIRNNLVSDFDIDEGTADKDIMYFIDELRTKSLLDTAEGTNE